MSILTKKYFHDERAAFAELESLLWPDGSVCPHCGSIGKVYDLSKTRVGLKKCAAKECRKQFTVRVGTIFEDSHIPLHKWLQAVHLLCSSKKGISSHQLHRTLEITYKSAWFMTHRLREAMRSGAMAPMGGGGSIVEVDETVYGRAATHPKGRQRFRSSQHKNVILSLVERGGNVRSYHVAGSTVSEVIPIINANVKRETALMSDAAQLYKYRLGNFASHERVDHSSGEYVRYVDGAPPIHSNTVENYFSVFKRGMRGTYQHCKEKHLHRYLAEFDFRHNNRSALGIEDEARAKNVLRGAKGKRLTYRVVDRKQAAEAR